MYNGYGGINSYNTTPYYQQNSFNNPYEQQQRVNQYQQAQLQNSNQMQPNAPSLKGRPVTSIEEVRGAMIDLDGSITYFTDLANGKIYTKQCNLDGTSSIQTYTLDNSTSNKVEYVSKEEFENLKTEIEGYKKMFLGGANNE